MKRLVFNRCEAISEIVAGKSVLDIGCIDHSLQNRKAGRWLHEHVKKTARSVLGLDYEEAEVRKLREQGYDVVAADATNFNLGQKFDAIVAGEIIEHVLNPGGFLQSAHLHLNPGGLLILTTPNANCLIYFLENLIIGREIDNPDHVTIFSPTTLKLLLYKCGFRVERLVFIAENTSYCHTSNTFKALVWVKQLAQVTLGLIRPSMCHHFLIVATPISAR